MASFDDPSTLLPFCSMMLLLLLRANISLELPTTLQTPHQDKDEVIPLLNYIPEFEMDVDHATMSALHQYCMCRVFSYFDLDWILCGVLLHNLV